MAPETQRPEEAEQDPLLARLREHVGRPAGPVVQARDPVNRPMIHHWIDAIGDENPLYVDPGVAREHGYGDVVAPPTMLSIWVRDHVLLEDRDNAQNALMELLDEAGYTSVVATNATETYERYLEPGTVVVADHTIAGVSPRKSTGLGEGYFIDRQTTLRDLEGTTVGTIDFRVLKFRPRARGGATPSDQQDEKPAAPRPRPAINHDTKFFWEAMQQRRLVAQRCSSCGELRHPPGPGCPWCGSLDVQIEDLSGAGHVYSFAVVHRPQIPAFEYPLPIVLVELDEGIRLVANIDGVAPDELEIGQRVEVSFEDVDDELTLPVFRPTD